MKNTIIFLILLMSIHAYGQNSTGKDPSESPIPDTSSMKTINDNELIREKSDPDEFSEWVMNYYKKPEPNLIVPLIKKSSESGVFSDVQNIGPPLFGFIAGALKKNPELTEIFAKDLSTLDEKQYSIILIGIWYADVPNSKNVIETSLKDHPNIKNKYEFLSTNPVSLLSVPARRGPWVLDAMWGYFFATGEDDPIIKIISVLPWIDESKESEIISMGEEGLNLMTTAGAAKWSLISNARQHKRVLEICENQISKQPEPIATQLKDIILNAKK